jgi:hypothetical protein
MSELGNFGDVFEEILASKNDDVTHTLEGVAIHTALVT